MKRLFIHSIAPMLERSWLKGSALSWLLAPLLWPISKMVWYGWLLGRWISPPKPPQKLPVPLLVVGNVYVGGVGKTPVVIALVEHCQQMGLRVGVVSRGYRAYDSNPAVSREPHLLQAHDLAVEVGDEPMLIFKRTGAPICICPHRYEAAKHLLNAHPDLSLIISDDGLQSSDLLPDMTVCVFDDRGLGNAMTLPAGPLREPWPRIKGLHPSQLAPYQWVVNTGVDPQVEGHHALRRLGAELINANGERLHWEDLKLKNSTQVLALAGVARPELFFQMLRAQGLSLEACWALPDHADLADYEKVLKQLKNRYPNATLVSTEKDAVKLWTLQPQALTVTLELSLPNAFWVEFEKALKSLLNPL